MDFDKILSTQAKLNKLSRYGCNIDYIYIYIHTSEYSCHKNNKKDIIKFGGFMGGSGGERERNGSKIHAMIM